MYLAKNGDFGLGDTNKMLNVIMIECSAIKQCTLCLCASVWSVLVVEVLYGGTF